MKEEKRGWEFHLNQTWDWRWWGLKLGTGVELSRSPDLEFEWHLGPWWGQAFVFSPGVWIVHEPSDAA